ncbi:hypothetical protein R70723_32385 [Paenibacillus sp. FSL R7-0273]|uniref:hypothetical protein n=1 Tax=Paenibacillus sp. FSL R7-0273 TaxID=1536772 RepID=UPI0004F912BE|nr:hypothetical protein [Paenibacillus sp. FSL R7-0273]AIQ50059.1 hypothetical protein R70723_32385 [Paenibacillus sp. FSL R7-0273]OMF90931.1 hypothetical protein BK144_16830 [Paenibacillus sp. FSL R7-0273]
MKIVKYATGVCLIVVLASALSVLTTAYVVNTYIQSVLASFDIKLDSPAPGIGGFVKSLTGMNAKTDPGSTAGQTKEPAADSDKENKEGTPAPDSDKPVEEKVPEDALAVMGQPAAEEDTDTGNLDGQLVMTPGDMSEMKDNIPEEDKVGIFNILMTKLPQEEMQSISTAMEDGLTETEVKEIQEVIAKYVNQDEYELLMKMLTPDPAGNP